MKVFLYSAKQSSSRCTWLLEMNSRLSLVAVLRKEVLDVLQTGRLSQAVVVPEHGAFAAAAVAAAAVVVVFAVA